MECREMLGMLQQLKSSFWPSEIMIFFSTSDMGVVMHYGYVILLTFAYCACVGVIWTSTASAFEATHVNYFVQNANQGFIESFININ
jgi:hypothetical protein